MDILVFLAGQRANLIRSPCNIIYAAQNGRKAHASDYMVKWPTDFHLDAAERAYRRMRFRVERSRIVDMSASNSWAEFAGIFRHAFLDHERSKAELKAVMPSLASFAKRSKSGAVSFDLLEARRTAMQRSSETIGTIAAALAKAQAQLVNP
jgi:hypothetical protein